MTIKSVCWIALAIILIEVVMAFVLLPQLPEQIPVHWNARGEVDSWGSKWMIFMFPAISLIMTILLMFLPKIDPLGDNLKRSEKAYSITILAVNLLMAVLFIVSTLIALGSSIAMEKVIFLAMGLMFIILGNFLPKAKRNYFYGIRLPWTLVNDEVWARTHRLGGWLFVGIGLLFLISLFLPAVLNFYIPISGVFVTLVILCVYSYLLYRKIQEKT